jgi:hypothetical protein
MAGRLTGNNLAKRDNEMAQARLQGLTYKELSKKFGITTAGVSYVLTKPDIKTMIEGGTAEIISQIPKACEVQSKAMNCVDDNGNPTALALKASENVLKTGSIIPGAIQNQTINNIYSQTNNIITAETMELVRKLLPGFNEEVIDADTN